MTSLVVEKGVDVSITVFPNPSKRLMSYGDLIVESSSPFDLNIDKTSITIVPINIPNTTDTVIQESSSESQPNRHKKQVLITDMIYSVNVRHGAKASIDWYGLSLYPQCLGFYIGGELKVNGHRCEISQFKFCSSGLSQTSIEGFVILEKADIYCDGITHINCYKRGNIKTRQTIRGFGVVHILG